MLAGVKAAHLLITVMNHTELVSVQAAQHEGGVPATTKATLMKRSDNVGQKEKRNHRRENVRQTFYTSAHIQIKGCCAFVRSSVQPLLLHSGNPPLPGGTGGSM